jgi:uncharacterized protein YecA (UPF0149 family)
VGDQRNLQRAELTTEQRYEQIAEYARLAIQRVQEYAALPEEVKERAIAQADR